MKANTWIYALIIILLLGCSVNDRIDLSGKWAFKVDPKDKGISERWFSSKFEDVVQLPGSMSTNNKGEDISINTKWTGQIVDSSLYKEAKFAKYRQSGNIKIPFWLQPNKHYVGSAWYQKEVDIPQNWKEKHIELYLERCHWETHVWIDNNEAGIQNALGAPHVYDLSKFLSPGKHILTVLVDNRIKNVDVGSNASSITDHTQTNWNGMIGKLELRAKPLLYISNVKVFPNIESKKILVKVTIVKAIGKTENYSLRLFVSNIQRHSSEKLIKVNSEIIVSKDTTELELEYSMGNNPLLWDEFNPNLYKLNVTIENKESEKDSKDILFGMREIKIKGMKIIINNKPVFMRGTLECAIFPKTGFPPTDTTEWMRIFRIARSYGLNHFRFHSWCPPEAAFEAADKLGFYLQIESSAWMQTGEGKPIDKFIYAESERIVNAFGNHPSFCMLLYGNESWGNTSAAWLNEFCKFWKNKDSRRLYSSAAGFPIVSESDFNNDCSPRIQAWGQGLGSIINSKLPSSDYDWSNKISKTKPTISHEIGQWCVYPDFKEISQYDGILKPKNFEIFKETLAENQMAALADSFVMASGKLQVLCYKAEMEAALRTKGFGGFQLLDLHDFPGQGTALIGVLNPFWKSKGYVTPQEYRQFCNTTVPLIRLPKMIYYSNETLKVPVEVAHFGQYELYNVIPSWKITDVSGKIIANGFLPKTSVPIGNGFKIGEINQSLLSIVKAQKLTLSVKLDSFQNNWDIWVYPSFLPEIKENILVTQLLDKNAIEVLNKGGSVLLTLKKGSIKANKGGNIAVGFSSVFWNTAWTQGQAPHTLGILCNSHHPALADFPTDYFSNWQWWDAISHCNAIIMSDFSPELKPIVRIIDTWFENRPLALIFEAKVGNGKIIICGTDLISDADKRPEAKQLLYSLKQYMTENSFNPHSTIEIGKLKALLN